MRIYYMSFSSSRSSSSSSSSSSSLLNDVKKNREQSEDKLSAKIKSLNISYVCIDLSIIFDNYDSTEFKNKFSLTDDDINVLQEYFGQTFENKVFSELVTLNANRILNIINTSDTIESQYTKYTLEQLYYEFLMIRFFGSFNVYNEVQSFLSQIPKEIEVVFYADRDLIGEDNLDYFVNYEIRYPDRMNFIINAPYGIFNPKCKMLGTIEFLDFIEQNKRENIYSLVLKNRVIKENVHMIFNREMNATYNIIISPYSPHESECERFHVNDDNMLIPKFDRHHSLIPGSRPRIKTVYGFFKLLLDIFNTIKVDYKSMYTIDIIGKVWFDIECDKHMFIIPVFKMNIENMYVNICKLISIPDNSKSPYCGNYNVNKYRVYVALWKKIFEYTPDPERSFWGELKAMGRRHILEEVDSNDHKLDRVPHLKKWRFDNNDIYRIDMLVDHETKLLKLIDYFKILQDPTKFTPINNFYNKGGSSKKLTDKFYTLYLQHKREYLELKSKNRKN